MIARGKLGITFLANSIYGNFFFLRFFVFGFFSFGSSFFCFFSFGKLSLIGIFRGDIDFSERESVSSKFLDLISDSYYADSNDKTRSYKLKPSQVNQEKNSNYFNLNHKKLFGVFCLIDVIAIIQEVNL